jgi:hypothetical protein
MKFAQTSFNNSPEPAPVGAGRSASRFTVFGPAWLSFFRYATMLMQPNLHRALTIPLIVMQVVSLLVVWLTVQGDRGWLFPGEADWRGPVVRAAGIIGLAVIPVVGVVVAFAFPRFQGSRKALVIDMAFCGLAWLGIFAVTH